MPLQLPFPAAVCIPRESHQIPAWHQWQCTGFKPWCLTSSCPNNPCLLNLALNFGFKVPNFILLKSSLSSKPGFKPGFKVPACSWKQKQKGTQANPEKAIKGKECWRQTALENLVVRDFSCCSSVCHNHDLNLFQMSFSLPFAKRKGGIDNVGFLSFFLFS